MGKPLKRFVHRCAVATPTTLALLYGGFFGAAASVADTDQRAKLFISDQITFWLSVKDSTAMISVAVVGFIVWFAVFLWSWEWHTDYEPIESKLPDKIEQEGLTTNILIQPDDAVHAHTVGVVNATLADDTLVATGVLSLRGLYVGNIIASASDLRNENRLDLAIIGFNASDVSVSVASISGRIRGGSGNFKDMIELPAPALVDAIMVDSGKEFVISLQQHLPPKIASQFLKDIEKSHLTLDLQYLELTAISVSNQNKKVKLPLWDAVTLKRRDDVVSNRVTVLSATGAAAGFSVASAFSEVEIKMQVNRTDGTAENGDD